LTAKCGQVSDLAVSKAVKATESKHSHDQSVGEARGHPPNAVHRFTNGCLATSKGKAAKAFGQTPKQA